MDVLIGLIILVCMALVPAAAIVLVITFVRSREIPRLRAKIHDLEQWQRATMSRMESLVDGDREPVVPQATAEEKRPPAPTPAASPEPPVSHPLPTTPPVAKPAAPRPPVVQPVAAPPPPASARTVAPTRPAPATRPSALSVRWGRLRQELGGEEWELVVGGSWMNKLGVLVTIVGLALLLAYSLTQVGPAGKVLIGFVLSGVMLGGGVYLERRARYKIFATGLIGGGWAGLYFTTYAMHGLPAARIVENPVLGTLLLTAVAAGMIVHSLHYRSEWVTGLAFFITFVTLNITPLAAFSIVASAVLAGALLYVASRFAWFGMALLGLVSTYATFAVRYAGGWATDSTAPQIVLLIYWVLFEAFDLVALTRDTRREPKAQAVFPLNLVGFVGVSMLHWSGTDGRTVALFLAVAAAAYALSAVIRARLRKPSREVDFEQSMSSARGGGYEAPVTIATALLTIAALVGVSGYRLNLALLLEAQFLFVAGVFLGWPYLRMVSVVPLALALVALHGVDRVSGFELARSSWKALTPFLLLNAAVFYLDGTLARGVRAIKRLRVERVYTYVASALVIIALAVEVQPLFLVTAWLLLGIALVEIGVRRGIEEFRFQGYGASVLAMIALAMWSTPHAASRSDLAYPVWLTFGIPAVLLYAGVWRLGALRRGILSDHESRAARVVASSAGAVTVALILAFEVPAGYLGVAWLAQALVLLEAGLRSRLSEFRVQSWVLGGLGLGCLALLNVAGVDGRIGAAWVPLGAAAILSYFAMARVLRPPPDSIPTVESRPVGIVASWAGTLLLGSLIWYLLPPPLVALGWGVLALLMLELEALPVPHLRAQSAVMAGLGFGRLFLANLTISGGTAGISHRLLTVVPMIVLFYYLSGRIHAGPGQHRARDWRAVVSRLYLHGASLLVVLLMRFELGPVRAVVGWALFCVALVYLSGRLENAHLRWQGSILALLIFVRSWSTNFHAPEEVAGAVGRVVTGAIVIACLFAGQLLLPRTGPGNEPSTLLTVWHRIDRNSRSIFSILASGLLTVLLFYESSGGLLTVALGLQGLGLMAAGFPLRERVMRLNGLALFLFCIAKMFAYDLRALETGHRILSFVMLGLLMIGVSWAYTRYRDRVRRLL